MAKTKTIKKAPIPDEMLAQFDALVSAIPGLERKGATVPYVSVNGHMFAYITADADFALRLPKEKLPDFFAKYKTKNPVSYGAVMKEYAVVPPALLKKTKELAPYFKESYSYVSSLKPKPTKKSAK